MDTIEKAPMERELATRNDVRAHTTQNDLLTCGDLRLVSTRAIAAEWGLTLRATRTALDTLGATRVRLGAFDYVALNELERRLAAWAGSSLERVRAAGPRYEALTRRSVRTWLKAAGKARARPRRKARGTPARKRPSGQARARARSSK